MRLCCWRRRALLDFADAIRPELRALMTPEPSPQLLDRILDDVTLARVEARDHRRRDRCGGTRGARSVDSPLTSDWRRSHRVIGVFRARGLCKLAEPR